MTDHFGDIFDIQLVIAVCRNEFEVVACYPFLHLYDECGSQSVIVATGITVRMKKNFFHVILVPAAEIDTTATVLSFHFINNRTINTDYLNIQRHRSERMCCTT